MVCLERQTGPCLDEIFHEHDEEQDQQSVEIAKENSRQGKLLPFIAPFERLIFKRA